MYYDHILKPALTAIRLKCIVEIGAERGLNTRKILSDPELGAAIVHVIDPEPHFDIPAFREQFGGRFVLHQALSFDALQRVSNIDVALINGDHNYYTVFNELALIDSKTQETGHPFPLIFLHDVGWLYGRRDMYYNPSNIPEGHRHAHEKKGMHPRKRELVQNGINRDLENALVSHTPKNGVLTAVIDFYRATEIRLKLILIPGFHGLAMLFRPELEVDNPAFGQFARGWQLSPGLVKHVEMLESARLSLIAGPPS